LSEEKLCYGCMQHTVFTNGICSNCGYYENTKTDPLFLKPGTQLHSRYLVGSAISMNGEGITYLAYDYPNTCRVLLREYMPHGFCSRVTDSAVIRVQQNCLPQYKVLMEEFTELHKSIAQLRGQIHVNPVIDLFTENNTTYVVLEFIEGISFVDYLKDNAGELTWAQFSRMLPPFLTSLSLLHNVGVVHRAISPETIFVTDKNELYLTDFSISAVRTANTELECEIYSGYAAPEQYSASNRQGTWTDVYAVCAVLYRVLTGTMPTSAISRMENDNLTAPALLNPNIPRHVSNVIMHGLSLVSNDRIQTITELVTQLFHESAQEYPQQNAAAAYGNPQTPPIYTTERYDNPMANGNPGYTTTYPVQNENYQQQPNYSNSYQESQQEYTDDYAYDDYQTEDYGKQSYQKENAVSTEPESVADRTRLPLIIGILLLTILLVAVVLFVRGKLNNSDHKNNSSMVTTVATEEEASQENTSPNSANSIMPMLIGKNYENQAKQYADWIRFQVEEVYSDQYEAGIIIWQEYNEGDYFDSSEPVKIQVSKGSANIELPSWEGKSLNTYLEELKALGVRYVTQDEENQSVANGYITRISLPAGEKYNLETAEEIIVYYANNPVITEPPTEPPTEAPQEPATEAPTEPPATEAPQEPVTEAPADPNVPAAGFHFENGIGFLY